MHSPCYLETPSYPWCRLFQAGAASNCSFRLTQSLLNRTEAALGDAPLRLAVKLRQGHKSYAKAVPHRSSSCLGSAGRSVTNPQICRSSTKGATPLLSGTSGKGWGYLPRHTQTTDVCEQSSRSWLSQCSSPALGTSTCRNFNNSSVLFPPIVRAGIVQGSSFGRSSKHCIRTQSSPKSISEPGASPLEQMSCLTTSKATAGSERVELHVGCLLVWGRGGGLRSYCRFCSSPVAARRRFAGGKGNAGRPILGRSTPAHGSQEDQQQLSQRHLCSICYANS